MMPIPDLIKPRLYSYYKHLDKLAHPMKDAAKALVGISDFVARHMGILKELMETDDCQHIFLLADYHQQMAVLQTANAVLFAHELRMVRHRQFIRLLLREYVGLASTQETMASWSDCAEALTLKTLDFCEQELSKRFGYPMDEEGNRTALYTIAMGKLGGRELNFSSDIDLIFAYSKAGFTQGGEVISNHEYYCKLVQLFIQLMQQVSADGLVFRVDLRLRPNGESGALVCSLAAMETYYQEQGRDWERYAMVKARVLGQEPAWFQRLIIPFVYRRYIDFSVIESLRGMKAMIEREVRINPRLDDIKRGRGGIREIEFIIQNIQLIRGGRIPQLRIQNSMQALEVLKDRQLLTRTEALKQAYLFFRRLENWLQSQDDRQTHALPSDALKQTQISFAMGFAHWEQLSQKLQQYQRIVSMIFHSVLLPVNREEDEERLLANQLSALWQGHVEPNMAINLLRNLGFEESESCFHMLYLFRHSPRCRRLGQAARMRLDRFIPVLLQQLNHRRGTDKLLSQVLSLLDSILGRSAYLALLDENPQVLSELLYWFANSQFITSLLVSQPFLLEILLESEGQWKMPVKTALRKQLKMQLAQVADIEAKQECLRQFKLTQWFHAARAEASGRYDSLRIARFLSEVAELIVTEVFNLACEQLLLRHPEIKEVKHQISILAYGKLGSREMNYDSDLDLVFIHNAAGEQEPLVTRLTQKIIHMLSMRSQSGHLYAVDMRLRPSGASGLLVSPVNAFIDYQRHQAWTWEHQALLRARVIYGPKSIRDIFLKLKVNVLSVPREVGQLALDVLSMRRKIQEHQNTSELKFAPGGLVDLEFLVQFLILANPDVIDLRYSNTLSFLQHLLQSKRIERGQFSHLKSAYHAYHRNLHQIVLHETVEDCSHHFAIVQAILDAYLMCDSSQAI